jgi:glycosyltransferase involved in cell wall biosynthesis
MKSLGILWAQYGPYHLARVRALKQQAGPLTVHALELANETHDYRWERAGAGVDLITLCPGSVAERLPFGTVFQQARRKFSELRVEACLLPSYSPKQSLAALLAAKSLSVRAIMMNESHAGTARATGLSACIKRRLIGLFDAALVGGTPQKRYFASMGLPADRIFTGYDAVDNDYFARRADEARDRASEVRGRYELPERFFLNLGRFVAKKNLGTLIRAYREFLSASSIRQTHLVMVGSGEEGATLQSLCHELNLPVYDKSAVPGPVSTLAAQHAQVKTSAPGVHFYGFRQVQENPIFYALADAFILPSLYEEWGLVVNEAMACGLPVVVSQTAGCAEDLLEPGAPSGTSHGSLPGMNGPASGPRLCQNGFLFNPESPADLAQALAVLDASPELRRVMGKASGRIVESFSCAAFARNALLAAAACNGTRAGRR